jgi:succinyl-CoA synthetase alpha subunit
VSILVDKNTRLLVQGITGKAGLFHAEKSIKYGTNRRRRGPPPARAARRSSIVPVFDTVADCVKATGANVSVIFVPPPFAADAIMEAAAAEVPLIVTCITEGIPVADMVKAKRYLQGRSSRLRRPELPRPHHARTRCKHRHHARLHPQARQDRRRLALRHPDLRGRVAGDDRSASASPPPSASAATRSTARASSTSCELFAKDDPETRAVIMIGEIGGSAEEEAAAFIKAHMNPKPVVGFIAGVTAPPGKRMGHAGAIIAGGKGTAEAKLAALKDAGVTLAETPSDLGSTMAKVLGHRTAAS